MKNCTDCIHAVWKRTSNGRLHPDGRGQCAITVKIPKLPNAFYWSGMMTPSPYGGFIDRKHEFKEDCIYGARK